MGNTSINVADLGLPSDLSKIKMKNLYIFGISAQSKT